MQTNNLERGNCYLFEGHSILGRSESHLSDHQSMKFDLFKHGSVNMYILRASELRT